jgi:V/A-type H+-transporting ATPase subunit E
LSFQAIQDRILEKARREAAALVKEASDERVRGLASARKDAEKVVSRTLEEANAEAKLRYEEKLGSIRTDLRRRVLMQREELIDQAWAQAMERLRSYVRTKDYASHLKESIIRTAKLVESDQLRVDASSRDLAMVKGFKDEVEKALAKDGFPKKLIIGQSVDRVGGFELSDSERRVVLDRTYEAKMRKLRPLLRSKLAQLLIGGME